MIEIPLLLLYLGTIAQVHGGSAIWHETRALIPGLLLGVDVGGGAGRDSACSWPRLTGRRAFATGAVAIFFLLRPGPDPAASDAASASRRQGDPAARPHQGSPGGEVAGLLSPFTDLDGVRMWLGGTTRGAESPAPAVRAPCTA